MISLVLAESSLELVPKKIQQHSSVLSHADKLGKKPSEILLDNSWHFAAMKGIENEIKRGRPDITHLCLMESCRIPLYYEKKIKIYIHTIDDNVIFIGENVMPVVCNIHNPPQFVPKLLNKLTIGTVVSVSSSSPQSSDDLRVVVQRGLHACVMNSKCIVGEPELDHYTVPNGTEMTFTFRQG